VSAQLEDEHQTGLRMRRLQYHAFSFPLRRLHRRVSAERIAQPHAIAFVAILIDGAA
jgi:hypothetical protein